jgi:hypothetical protein|tara:strand:- start:548 stop:703 length:156 start_codon:yes stop_codon:yes gene_type:complete
MARIVECNDWALASNIVAAVENRFFPLVLGQFLNKKCQRLHSSLDQKGADT